MGLEWIMSLFYSSDFFMKKSHYVVWEGKSIGVFSSWGEVSPLVTGVRGARFKGFNSKESAEEAFLRPWQEFIETNKTKHATIELATSSEESTTQQQVVDIYEQVEFSTEPPW